MLCKVVHRRLLFEVRPLFHLTGISFYSSHVSKNNAESAVLKTKKVTEERTITPEDVNLFSNLTGDHNPIHSNSKNKHGIVHGAFLNGLVSGVIGTRLPGHGTIVLEQTLRFPNPCYVGETVEVSVEVDSMRKILKCKYQVVDKIRRSVVLEGEAKLLNRNSSNN